MTQQQQIELSIVVMFTHDPELTRECLASIESVQDELPATETIFILNAASPEVCGLVRESAGAQIIESSVNTGTAVAWQLGFTRARGEFVLLMHEDGVALPGMIPRLIQTLREEPTAAAVGPWLEEEGERADWNAGWVRFGGHGIRLVPDDLPPSIDRELPYAIEEVSSAISLWRRSAWLEIGGFDERTYPAISVEADSFAALSARGWSVLSEPRARGRHRSGIMTTAPSLLSGPHIRNYLGERFEKLWAEKWAGRADWFSEVETFPPPEHEIHAAIERAQVRRHDLPKIDDPARSEQPLTNPDKVDPAPNDMTPEIEQRLRAKERELIDGYTRWLIERDRELSRRYDEVYAAYNQLSADAETYRRDFDAVVGSRWWRLGAALRRLRPTRRS